MNNTEQSILKTLGYFDLFHYPVTRDEILSFHEDRIAALAIDIALEQLVRRQYVFLLDGFYSLHNDHALVQRRLEGNRLAVQYMHTAAKVSKFLSAFPFIKGIAVSGSLSKNFATADSDIDFFIVTAANRLWIARTLMHLYKKLTFLTGRQHWYCMNYYVDEAQLEIPEQNIFTAMEIITLVPMQGKTGLNNFFNNNVWTKQYFPVHQYNNMHTHEIEPGVFRKWIERVLQGKKGDWLDQCLMRITDKRWKKKSLQHKVNSRGVHLGMVVDRHCSKPDPKNFQEKIITQYENKVQQLLQQHRNAALQLL
ncbi:MAG: nucleotidyltransferase domain-containing protein [Bacteroidetes bacterium]|nr:nucleotidyltransferase domain-containing protein [Bacteroidota bacterium]